MARGIKTKVLYVAVLAALLACCVLCMAGCNDSQGGPQAAKVSVTVKADGWAKGASSAAVVVFSDKDGKAILSHALDCNGAAEFEAPSTATAAKVISPVNADGSAYSVAGAVAVVPESGKTVDAAVELTAKAAADTSAADLEAIIKDLGEAAKVGDKTMAGDAGRAVIELARKNAAANPNADAEAIEAAAEEAEAAAASAAVHEASASSGGSSSGGSSSGTSGGGTAGHTHTWATRYVVDSVAWTEEVYHPMEGEQYVEYYDKCTVCGADCTADPGGHIISAHGGHGSWASSARTITTITQEAYTEYIEHPETGHNETYCSGCGAVQ